MNSNLLSLFVPLAQVYRNEQGTYLTRRKVCDSNASLHMFRIADAWCAYSVYNTNVKFVSSVAWRSTETELIQIHAQSALWIIAMRECESLTESNPAQNNLLKVQTICILTRVCGLTCENIDACDITAFIFIFFIQPKSFIDIWNGSWRQYPSIFELSRVHDTRFAFRLRHATGRHSVHVRVRRDISTRSLMFWQLMIIIYLILFAENPIPSHNLSRLSTNFIQLELKS